MSDVHHQYNHGDIVVRKTTEKDLEAFYPSRLDRLEAKVAGVPSRIPNVDESMLTVCLKGFEEEPLIIGGNQGDRVWFVTSVEVQGLSGSLKWSIRNVLVQHRDYLLTKYETLWNYMYLPNTPHVKFLVSIGAVFHYHTVTPDNFIMFTINKEV